MAVADRRHRLPDPAAGPRVHARAGGGQPVDSRHRPAQHHAGAPGRDRQAGAGDHGHLPRGGVDRRPARPARRRHRHGGFYNSEYFVPLRPEKDWPHVVEQTGWRRWLCGAKRPRTKEELVKAMNAELEQQAARRRLELLAEHPRQRHGGALRRQGRQLGQDLRPRPRPAGRRWPPRSRTSCKRSRASRTWASSTSAASRTWSSASIRRSARSGACMTADVNNVVGSALGAKALSSMVEGEKLFDIAVRWPKWRRNSETSILDIPVDIVNNQVVLAQGPGVVPVGDRHRPCGRPPRQARWPTPPTRSAARPRLRLRDLVTPVGEDGATGPRRPVRARRRLDHLPRAGQAHDRHQVQRPRPRPGQRRGRGHGERPRTSSRRPTGRSGAASSRRWRTPRAGCCHHPAVAGPDLHPALLGLPLVPGRGRGLQQRLRRGRRRHLGAVPDRHELQHLGGGRLRLALRRGHHGRAAADLLLQRPARPGAAAARGHHARSGEAGAAGDDDRADRHPGPAAGGRLDARSARRRSGRWPSWWSAA